jgi:hypothetical protein
MSTTHVRTHQVEINAQEYAVEGDFITLVQIRERGGIPRDHKVYHEVPEPVDDPEVTEGDQISLHKLEKFYSVSPAITGGRG